MNDITNTLTVTQLVPREAFDRTPVRGTEHNNHPQYLPATKGNFSEPYFNRMKRSLEIAAALTEHVSSMINVASRSDDDVSGTKDAPLPFNATAFQDANGIYATVVYFTRLWADRLKRQAPGPAKRAWTQESGRVIGLPADITPGDARYQVSIMTTWLVAHLEDICWQHGPDVEFMHDELKTFWTIASRWPSKVSPHYSPMPCPTDGGRVAIYPAEVFDGDETFTCEKCGRRFAPGEYQAYVAAYLKSRAAVGAREAAKELRVSDRVRDALARKYGSAAGRAAG